MRKKQNKKKEHDPIVCSGGYGYLPNEFTVVLNFETQFDWMKTGVLICIRTEKICYKKESFMIHDLKKILMSMVSGLCSF